jgi:aspartyl-tRNA(Asn)/glutamyl-tRNA(Gln) amidotransferase subunit A
MGSHQAPVRPLILAEARARIRAHEDTNAFISVMEDDPPHPLRPSGPPPPQGGREMIVAVKDLVDVRGAVTTGGGIILPLNPAKTDAPVIRRLRELGCVFIGKTNLHEWAFGLTSENPHYGAVRNPHDPERVAGGSSGGSAVAVALQMCDWALGTDTGGSIRIPAAYCGVVGFKPTIGTLDTEGVIPLSRTLDTLGPLAPDVRSSARALELMSGRRDLIPARPRAKSELRLAVPEGWGQDLDPHCMVAWENISRGLPRIPFPDRDRMVRAGGTILNVEAAAVHRRWLEMCPEKYGSDVLALLQQGLGISRAEYVDALLEQARLRTQAEHAMEGWDALLVPATRVIPPRIGEPYDRFDLSCYTRPFNVTGQPAITLPAPTEGLPVGVQVIGHFGQDGGAVEAALALESNPLEI